jgi:S-adenosylmethionine:tRNA ribosyltransferase-isomerase
VTLAELRSGARRPIPMSRVDYDLPPELIAQRPAEPRDSSRLLVMDRRTGGLQDRRFSDLPEYLRPGDLVVVNDTRVFPARLIARRETGGGVEFLLLSQEDDGCWLAMARPGRRLRPGEVLSLLDHDDATTADTVEVLGRKSDQVVVSLDPTVIERHGRVPLPPYIRDTLTDPGRYQTVYARTTGSAAAPTAGMHFTDDVISACRGAGATFSRVTLHVGLDTFQPIKVENARDHEMHSEWYRVPNPKEIREAKESGRRIIAVGTTSVRTLESASAAILGSDSEDAIAGRTDLFITPGYYFRLVDAMVTNFHLPRTTLMLLVAAFAGEKAIRTAYAHAIRERYRFYSFGDAMLIV